MARITAIYRYPVKSMMGESLKRADVADAGIPGDRAWAVRDEKFGGIKGAKRFPALMQCTARYVAPPSIDERSAPAAITLPDGTQTSTADGAINAKLSHALGRDVTLWPLLPASAKDHFKRGNPAHPDAKAELRRLFGREPGEPLPDLSQFPKELFEYESPPGTYFDAYPIMILSTTAM